MKEQKHLMVVKPTYADAGLFEPLNELAHTMHSSSFEVWGAR